MACSLCQQLQPKVRASTGTCTLNVSVRLLRLTDSAAAGCSFCGLIREGIDCYKHRLEGMDRIIEHAIIVRFLMIDNSLSKSDTKPSHHLAVELTWGSKKDRGGIGADWHFTADLKLYFMTSDGRWRSSARYQSLQNVWNLNIIYSCTPLLIRFASCGC